MVACIGQSDGHADGAPLAAEVARTSYGITHVQARDFQGLGYGLGYAYAQDNVCLFADSLLTVRGERSRFFGPDAYATAPSAGQYGAASDFIHLRNADSDFFFKGYLDLAQLKAGYANASADARDLLRGYAAGYNRYLRDAGPHLPAACAGAAWVRPISYEDMLLVLAEKALHASGEVFAQEFVDAGRSAAGVAAHPLPAAASASTAAGDLMATRLAALHDSLGSNALALGHDVTASGSGILMGNPHYPWTSTDRFYEAHLTVPGRYDAMGVVLGGIPIIVIGFNRDVAWSHTVTTAVHFHTVRLALDRADPSGTTYVVDGKSQPMVARPVSIEVKQPDGSLVTRSRTFYFSQFGPVIVKPDAGIAWTGETAYVLADPNRNNTRLIDQWLGIGRARNVAELKASLDKEVGLPWINTIAADREGTVLFADASVVPHVTSEQFANGCMVLPALLALDGTRSACAAGNDPGAPPGVFGAAHAPALIRTDYVANSNDSFWLTNPAHPLTGFSPMYGKTGTPQSLRTRIGLLQLGELLDQHRHLRVDDVEELVFADRIHAGELVVPDLLDACAGQDEALVVAACSALAGWDRRANLDSRGAVLFREFWNEAVGIPGKWAVPFDAANPLHTPRGMSPGAGPSMLAALRRAAARLKALGIALDAPLGSLQGETRNGVRVPIHGGIGDVDGSYNSIHMASGLDAQGYHNVAWGTSYVQVVGFDADGPVAQGLLVYGQSTDPANAHFADQLGLYSRKQLVALPFQAAAMRADPNYRSMHLSE
jgi:acyl-homoserine-lactone acylase